MPGRLFNTTGIQSVMSVTVPLSCQLPEVHLLRIKWLIIYLK